MDGFRAFIIGPDGHVINRVDILTDDEAEARRMAKTIDQQRPVELWRGARILGRFEPPEQNGLSLGKY